MPQKTVARKTCSIYGGWWEFLGCPSRKRQLVMIPKKAAAELEFLHALHVNTCLVCLWVPLLFCVGNIRVIFFRVLHSSCLVVRFRLSMITFYPPSHPLPRRWHVISPRTTNLLLGNLNFDQGGMWTLQRNTGAKSTLAPTCKGFESHHQNLPTFWSFPRPHFSFTLVSPLVCFQ